MPEDFLLFDVINTVVIRFSKEGGVLDYSKTSQVDIYPISINCNIYYQSYVFNFFNGEFLCTRN